MTTRMTTSLSDICPMNSRPHCAYCGARMRPQTWTAYLIDGQWVSARGDDPVGGGWMFGIERTTRFLGATRERRCWTGKYDGYGPFCKTLCADLFARAAFRAGYRMPGVDPRSEKAKQQKGEA